MVFLVVHWLLCRTELVRQEIRTSRTSCGHLAVCDTAVLWVSWAPSARGDRASKLYTSLVVEVQPGGFQLGVGGSLNLTWRGWCSTGKSKRCTIFALLSLTSLQNGKDRLSTRAHADLCVRIITPDSKIARVNSWFYFNQQKICFVNCEQCCSDNSSICGTFRMGVSMEEQQPLLQTSRRKKIIAYKVQGFNVIVCGKCARVSRRV